MEAGTSRRSEKLKPSSSPICCWSPWGGKWCWFWRSLPVPTNKSYLFFQTCWLRNSLENLWGGGERKGKIQQGWGGGGQPQGWREISYACALKRKVCGQLLKDFSGESRLSTESIEGVKEEKCCLLMPVQLNSAGVTQRHCQLCGCFFFFFPKFPFYRSSQEEVYLNSGWQYLRKDLCKLVEMHFKYNNTEQPTLHVRFKLV